MGVCLSFPSGSPASNGHDAGSVDAPLGASPPRHKSVEVPSPLPAAPQQVSAEVKDPRFKCCGPTVVAGDVKSCFDDGLLFLLKQPTGWYFYNDTEDYEMHVSCKFGETSEICAIPPATLERSNDGGFVVSVVVYPEETVAFIDGLARGYQSKFSARPLSKEYLSKFVDSAKAKVQRELEVVRKISEGSHDLHQIVGLCLKHGARFVDVVFPPHRSSLSRPGVDRREIDETAWQRPTDFLPPGKHREISLFCRGINPNDIDQGQLGDCWLLCSIAALAEFPSRVAKLFSTTVADSTVAEERHLGAYRVMINKHGWWETIIVDDYLPVTGKKPCFAKCIEDPAELWVSLIEKAYAKLHGSYAAITGGDALHALRDLTGYPATTFSNEWDASDSEKSAAMFRKLLKYDQSQFLINLNTPGSDVSGYMGGVESNNPSLTAERYNKAGLALGHAYTVLQVREFANHNVRLLQIRNPWGTGAEWTGRWGEGDSSWQQFPDIAATVHHEAAADGIFWMCWEDVLAYFDGGGVCFTHNGWHDYRAKGVFARGVPSVVFEVRTERPINAYVTISQRDRRCFSNSDDAETYSGLMISISKSTVSPNQQRIDLNSTNDPEVPSRDFTFNCARDLGMEYMFTPESSPYYIIPRVYNPADAQQYVLGLLSDDSVSSGQLHIRCMHLPEECSVFQNFPEFSVENAACVATSIQRISGSENLVCSNGFTFN